MSLTIVAIDESNKKAKKAFVKYPINVLYKDCPFYVPSLIIDELATLDKQKNPSFDFCESQLFLAYREDRIVGRIAAIINHEANRIWKQKSMRFGFVDFIDDNEVVDALFEAAENWGKTKGMGTIVGPMGFMDLDHEGLLVEGYDKVATMATTYSYPYYRTQIERMGFVKDADWKEFYIAVPTRVPERHQRIADMITKRYGLKLLRFKNLKQITPYLEKLFNLLNLAYAPLYGVTPLTQRQIDHYVKMYAPLLNWDMVQIIIKEETDELVGFGVSIPNLSQALIKSRGKLFPTGWFHLLKKLKGKNDVADLMLMGVAPEYQGKGVNAIIFTESINAANKHKFKYVESNPELEMNNKMVSLWDGFDAINHKVRRVYTKKID